MTNGFHLMDHPERHPLAFYLELRRTSGTIPINETLLPPQPCLRSKYCREDAATSYKYQVSTKKEMI